MPNSVAMTRTPEETAFRERLRSGGNYGSLAVALSRWINRAIQSSDNPLFGKTSPDPVRALCLMAELGIVAGSCDSECPDKVGIDQCVGEIGEIAARYGLKL